MDVSFSLETHIISAIINVAQDVDEPWPLSVLDFKGQIHHIEMQPGDLIWYESARLPHGRIRPLNGDYYDNIFVHFKPAPVREIEVINTI